MSTAIRRSAMFAVLALTIVGATAAQAQGFVPYKVGANSPMMNWFESHPIVSTSQAPTVANDVPSVVYPFPAIASAGHVEESLRGLGFTAVRSVSRSGNIFTAEAMWDGQWVDLRIDGRNGRITARPG